MLLIRHEYDRRMLHRSLCGIQHHKHRSATRRRTTNVDKQQQRYIGPPTPKNRIPQKRRWFAAATCTARNDRNAHGGQRGKCSCVIRAMSNTSHPEVDRREKNAIPHSNPHSKRRFVSCVVTSTSDGGAVCYVCIFDARVSGNETNRYFPRRMSNVACCICVCMYVDGSEGHARGVNAAVRCACMTVTSASHVCHGKLAVSCAPLAVRLLLGKPHSRKAVERAKITWAHDQRSFDVASARGSCSVVCGRGVIRLSSSTGCRQWKWRGKYWYGNNTK